MRGHGQVSVLEVFVLCSGISEGGGKLCSPSQHAAQDGLPWLYGKGSRPAEPSVQGSLLEGRQCACGHHGGIFIDAMA